MSAGLVGELPRTLRVLARGLGASRTTTPDFLSYLLFERGFTRALIDLGFRDAMARRDHVLALLRGDPMPAIDAPRRVAEDLSGQEEGAEAEESPEAHHVRHGR